MVLTLQKIQFHAKKANAKHVENKKYNFVNVICNSCDEMH